jgi:hypothetical protein
MRGMMKIIKIAPNFSTIAKREAKKIDTSSNVAHTGCAHRCSQMAYGGARDTCCMSS